MALRVSNIIDLFAGCGGMSLGFSRAGFRIAASVEKDAHAHATHLSNFNYASGLVQAEPEDITELLPSRFDVIPGGVQVVIGGPPCQAFSRIGRAKLRDIMAHPEAFLTDRRASLYTYFLEYVEHFHPMVVLMENVPEIMNFGGKNVAEEIALSLDDLGYIARYTVLNAALYGVPQFRSRAFILAYRADLGVLPEFPPCTHYIEIPSGYVRRNQPGSQSNQTSLPGFGSAYYVSAPEPDPSLHPAITAWDALSDLDLIYSEDIQPGPRKFDALSPYRSGQAPSRYAKDMRAWPGFVSSHGVCDHVTRFLPRDYRIFAGMEPGDQYPQAIRVAETLFEEALDDYAERHGFRPEPHTELYEDLRKQYVPPYDPSKFPNKWWKLVPDKPSRTLTAHLSRDTYTHIHYDSTQARTISVREAARLQSFPDGFRFSGAMGAAFKQIGNAVPPLLAYALANQIQYQLGPFLDK